MAEKTDNMAELIAAAGGHQVPAPKEIPVPPKSMISSDKGSKTPHVEVGPEAMKNYRSVNKVPDPSYIPSHMIHEDEYHYRYVNLRKIDYRRFQGYEPVPHDEVPIHQITAEGWVRLGDCVLMKVPIRQYEQTIKDRQEYWDALYDKKLAEAYNEADRVMPGSPYVIDPETNKEIG